MTYPLRNKAQLRVAERRATRKYTVKVEYFNPSGHDEDYIHKTVIKRAKTMLEAVMLEQLYTTGGSRAEIIVTNGLGEQLSMKSMSRQRKTATLREEYRLASLKLARVKRRANAFGMELRTKRRPVYPSYKALVALNDPKRKAKISNDLLYVGYYLSDTPGYVEYKYDNSSPRKKYPIGEGEHGQKCECNECYHSNRAASAAKVQARLA